MRLLLRTRNLKKLALVAGLILVLFVNGISFSFFALSEKIAKDKQELTAENLRQNEYYQKQINDLQSKQDSTLRGLEQSVKEATTSYRIRKEQQRIYLASLSSRSYSIYNAIPVSANIPHSTVVDTVKAAFIAQWGSWSQSAENLINSESGFNPNAQNPSSTAYGIFQFLDSTWQGYGCQKTADPKEQTRCGVKYIAERYGTPENAWNYHIRNNSY